MNRILNKILFQERLKELREKLGMTQQELTRLCELNVNQINRYERGTQLPSLDAATKISSVLDVSLDYLVGLSDDPHGQVSPTDLNVYEREIVEMFRREGWSGIARLGVERLTK